MPNQNLAGILKKERAIAKVFGSLINQGCKLEKTGSLAVSQEGAPNLQSLRPATRVLFVEDDSVYFNLLKQIMEAVDDAPFDILWACTLEQALKTIHEQSVDVILLDLNLPDSEGLSTFQRVFQVAEHIPIIVLSGSNDEKQAMETVRLGAQDFLIKSQIGVQSLVRCIRYTLARLEVAEYRERIQAINDFTAALAHDLRGPIIGAERLLAAMISNKESTFSENDASMLRILQSNNDFLRARIDALLQIYRLESEIEKFELEVVDLGLLLKTCVRTISTQSTKFSHEIVCTGVDGLQMHGNRQALNQLCMNLLENAVKFSEPGDRVEVSGRVCGNELELVFKDFGQGIAPDDLASLFKKFWRGGSHTFVPGTGLGLYLCEKIVRAHNGSIKCVSKLAEGSSFIIMLPNYSRSSVSSVG